MLTIIGSVSNRRVFFLIRIKSLLRSMLSNIHFLNDFSLIRLRIVEVIK